MGGGHAGEAARVYSDPLGRWYFKIRTGRDPITGQWQQLTRRGFRTAAEAGRARRDLLQKIDSGVVRPTPAGMTVNDLLDLYLDGIEADGRLSPKTCFDYRHYASDYVRPLLGPMKIRDVTANSVVAWQRRLAKSGGTKNGRPPAPNTIRLARAPLAGALKLAVSMGLLGVNPVSVVPRPRAARSVPRHWSPEQAREFLTLDGRRPDVRRLGVPARLRAADRRAGVSGLAECGPTSPPRAHRRVRLDPQL